ncbi:GGDEF domain-containing protein [Undibacterium sp. TJN25]|uniref:GGDEF domain-containing protein n=1 Tax=Undibacterium sp. TJN25 TaxID=3413056 RepID=UPI003BF390C7
MVKLHPHNDALPDCHTKLAFISGPVYDGQETLLRAWSTLCHRGHTDKKSMTESAAHLTTPPMAPLLEASAYRNKRTSEDLYKRALIGPVFYLLGCVLILAIAGYHHRWPLYSALPIAAFLLLWVLRYRHRPPAPGASAEAYTLWKREQWFLLHLGSVVWGVIPAIVGWMQMRPDSTVMVAAIATVAFGTAASQAFALHPAQARITILVLMLPAAAVFALPQLDLASTGITLFIYTFYLMANLKRSASEYAQQVDTEIDLISSRAEVARVSLTDTLTGLPNRLSYERAWEQAWNLAVRNQETLSLLMLDLDHFKQINDTYGHQGGDACLRHFAELLRRFMRRDSDIIARIGGEEFVVILPATTAGDARAMAEQLRVALTESPCSFEGAAIAMTVSIGLGCVEPGTDADPAATFRRVDLACYEAKGAGRNCVMAARPISPARNLSPGLATSS